MGQKDPPCTPQILREWYHFVQGTRLIDILHVNIEAVGMDSGFPPFFKMGPPFEITRAHISAPGPHTGIILLSKPMISGSQNSLESFLTILE